PPRRYGNVVGANRLTVGEEDGDIDVRCLVAGVEDAGSLVRDQSAIGKRTLRRDVSFGNSPMLAAYRLHDHLFAVRLPAPIFSACGKENAKGCALVPSRELSRRPWLVLTGGACAGGKQWRNQLIADKRNARPYRRAGHGQFSSSR